MASRLQPSMHTCHNSHHSVNQNVTQHTVLYRSRLSLALGAWDDLVPFTLHPQHSSLHLPPCFSLSARPAHWGQGRASLFLCYQDTNRDLRCHEASPPGRSTSSFRNIIFPTLNILYQVYQDNQLEGIYPNALLQGF